MGHRYAQMVVGEGFNREGVNRRRGKNFFILGILWFLGVALAAREMRNSIVARGSWVGVCSRGSVESFGGVAVVEESCLASFGVHQLLPGSRDAVRGWVESCCLRNRRLRGKLFGESLAGPGGMGGQS